MSRLLCLVTLACLVTVIAGLSPSRRRKPVCGWAPLAQKKYEKLDPFYSPSQFKVLNGEVPPDHIFPFTASLIAKKHEHNFCTATIIGERYVLTAAHCYFNGNDTYPKDLFVNFVEVTYGALDSGNSLRADVEDLIFTPTSNPFSFDDIMIVKLKEPINFNANVSPVCLASNLELPVGKELIISGYGNHSTGPDTYEKMSKYVVDTIPVANKTDCMSPEVAKRHLEHSFCAGAIEKGSMEGDSGGPMYALHKKSFYQAGIVASGYTFVHRLNGKQIRDDRAYYTRISDFCDFISTATEGDVECRTLS